MIIGFVGTPGSGKSYEAVKKIIDNLRLGREIWTNIDGLQLDTSREAIKGLCNMSDFKLDEKLHFLTNEQCRTFWDFVNPGSLVLIDEVHKLFSNRNWASEENKQFTEWASTHRHEGFDVVLITQDIEKIDKHARSLIEWTYFFRKMNQFGSLVKNKYTCDSYASDDHQGKPLAHNTRTYDPRIFACYSSYVAPNVVETGIMKHVNVLKHPIFYAIPVVIVIFVYFFSQSSFLTGDLFGVKKSTAAMVPKKNETSKNSRTPPVPVVASAVMPVAAPVAGVPVSVAGPPDSRGDAGLVVPVLPITGYNLTNKKTVYTNTGLPHLPPGVFVTSSFLL